MKTTCPYCATPTDGARVCPKCGRALIQRCVACAEDIPVQSATCPRCGTAQAAFVAAPRRAPSHAPDPEWLANERNVLLILLLWLLTCGLWGLVAMYQLGTDLRTHGRRSDLNPGLDILLGILTCGLWWIYTMYTYAAALRDLSTAEGGPTQDVTALCTVLEICRYFFCPGIVSTMVLQNELNQHWRRHAAGA
jgi:hypothetical protein